MTETGTSVSVDRETIVACDSHISWCRHRHRNDPEIEREMDKLIVYLRERSNSAEPEPEAKRTNRVMREVLTEHLSRLNREARKEGWA